MFVRKNSAKLGVVGLAASAVAFAALSPAGAATGLNPTLNQGAAANSTPVANSDTAKGTIVFAGSDTIQYVVADLAAAWNKDHAADKINNKTYNILSYNALADDGGAVAPLTGWNGVDGTTSSSITTPNGSGGGLKLLGATDAGGGSVISYARSSSAPDATGKLADGKSSDATGYPFALDTVVLAVSAKNTTAPSTISDLDVLKIYNGTDTNWSQVGGKSGAIHPLAPKSGSGTAKFFGGQVNKIDTANGGTGTVADSSGVFTSAANTYDGGKPVPEHSGAPLIADPNAVVPISLGRAILWNQTHSDAEDVKIIGGFKKQRALWIFARTANNIAGQTQVNPDVVAGGAVTKAILGNGDGSGFFCSAAAQAIVEADGFFPLTAKYCGAPKTSTGDIVPASGIATPDMFIDNPLLKIPTGTSSTGGDNTQNPPAVNDALKKAQAKLAKDTKALKAAKKALKKAKGHKKVVLKKKIAKLNKAIKADKKQVAAAK
jgi:ABC-type phosphate transport system substrate-binding protein